MRVKRLGKTAAGQKQLELARDGTEGGAEIRPH
jgi:hypothetical protein